MSVVPKNAAKACEMTEEDEKKDKKRKREKKKKKKKMKTKRNRRKKMNGKGEMIINEKKGYWRRKITRLRQRSLSLDSNRHDWTCWKHLNKARQKWLLVLIIILGLRHLGWLKFGTAETRAFAPIRHFRGAGVSNEWRALLYAKKAAPKATATSTSQVYPADKCGCRSGDPSDGGEPVDDFGNCHFCCSPFKYCGTGPSYCSGKKAKNCKSSKVPSLKGSNDETIQGEIVEAPPTVGKEDLEVLASELEWRTDGNCGAGFPSENYAIAACDPRSNTPCCSHDGECGNTTQHCISQSGGHDFRISFQVKQWQQANEDLLQTGALVTSHDESLKIVPHKHYHLYDAPLKGFEGGWEKNGQEDRTISGSSSSQFSMKYFTIIERGPRKASHMGIEWREDGKCGTGFATAHRYQAGCNPESEKPCCTQRMCTNKCRGGVDFRTITKKQLRPFKLERHNKWHGPMEHVEVCGARSRKEPKLPPKRSSGLLATPQACRYFESVYVKRPHHLVKLLDLLDFLNDEFHKVGGQFSLAYGSYIGAVRHGGPIPWDDDIDVHIRSKDVALFQELIKTSGGIFCVSRFWGGFKLFHCKSPPYKDAKKRGLNWRYPFIDVWDQLHDTSGASYLGGQQMCISPPCCSGRQLEELIFPTVPIKFAGKMYPSPRYPMRYLRSKWGNHVKELWQDCRVSTWDHSTETTKPSGRFYGRSVSCASLSKACSYPAGTLFEDGLKFMLSEKEKEWPGGKIAYIT